MGRRDRYAQGAHAYCGLVVGLHDRDGRVIQLCLASNHSFSLWGWGGGSVSEHCQDLLPLVSDDRTRDRAGHLLHGSPPGWRTNAALGYCLDVLRALAADLRAVRVGRVLLGRGL